MFHIVTGPFHPVLESSLVAEIQGLKSADPFAPLAIVVPSEGLRRRVQELLCVEQGLALYDVHFLTFHQLALRLYDERAPYVSQGQYSPFKLVSDLTFRQLLREILGRGISDLQAWSRFRQSPGLCTALWSTIRDLNEAMIDPFLVLEGIDEEMFQREDRDALRSLFILQARVLEAAQNLRIGSADDLAALVIPWVRDSLFLSRLGQVYYYGFYDLSQVQLSLFEAVTQKTNVTVYMPLVDDAAFVFAQRFHDRHLSAGAVSRKSESSFSSVPERTRRATDQPVVKIMNAVGVEDELTLVCKEIGSLIELHGYTFEEIGVVARTLEPYQSWLGRTFVQHRIPFTSSALIPLNHEPVIKVLFQLGCLASNRFPSNELLDVVRSPYYRVNQLSQPQELVQPELWQEIVQELGITRGVEQWLRLSTVVESDKGEVYGRVTGSRNLVRPDDWFDSIQLFKKLVRELLTDCQALPTHGRVEELTEAFMQLIRKHLVLPGFNADAISNGHSTSHAASLAEAIPGLFALLTQLDGLQETMTWDEWMSLLWQVMEDCSLPLEPGPHPGVRVLDAMAARGLPFRAIFILGLNEKVFPRFIREDAFLRDGHRRVLAETMGYKIDEKLSGYDEERLLFALLQQAARHRLYLSYQRADETGRPLAPSSFLREWCRHEGRDGFEQAVSLPKRFSDRLNDSLFRDSLLTPEELGLKLILRGMDPSVLLEAFDRESSLFQLGWNALADIERHTRELGPFDGMLESLDEHWQNLAKKGVSPTSLESYARCPFQYLASQMLQVSVMRNQMTDELPPSVVGTLCHAVLNQVYAQLIHDGWPDVQISSRFLQSRIASVLEDVFSAYAVKCSTGYWVVWQLLKDMVKELVMAEVESSRKEFVTSGFRPIAVEVDATGVMKLPGSRFGALKIQGRLDRVDYQKRTERSRVVDYKFKMSSQMKSQERDLLVAGVRGYALQPVVYSFMSEFRVRHEEGETHQSLSPERVEFVYLAPRRVPMVSRSVFERTSWDSKTGQQLKKTLENLLTGIKDGHYFILPGDYCDHCHVSTACRRFHEPTLSRSYRSEQAKQLRHVRKQEIARD